MSHVGDNEEKYIAEALKDAWIVPLGPHVTEFERRLGEYLGKKNIVALSAGTAALHLGLLMAGVGKGDEVICQSFTFAASCNPIVYLGGSPVFVDSERDTWNMDPELMEEAIIERHRLTGHYPKAIVAVHLYGMPSKIDRIMEIADRYAIPVVEDAAEALGSEFRGKKCGTFGEYGTLSFNGNKIITTSGGGALICPTREAAERVLFYATQAREKRPYYYHEVIGYNYRLSNISACVGLGQMDVLEEHLKRRREIHELYRKAFTGNDRIAVKNNPGEDFDSNYWLTTVTFEDGTDPDRIRRGLAEKEIETRLLWRPMQMMPVYKDAPFYGNGTSEDLFNRGLCLPSGSNLTDSDIKRVITAINDELA